MDELKRLKIAFQVDVLRHVATADGRVDDREWDLIDKAWPEGALEELGYIDDDGPTDVWRADAARAREVLKDRLSEADKLNLLGSFYAVCLADGALHPREMAEVHRAAGTLGVSVERLGQHLDALSGHGDAAPPRKP